MASKTYKIFPGWFVVAAGFLIMATCYTTFINCIALFQAYIVKDLGLTLSQYNLSSSISTLMSIVGAAAVGILADRVSSRVLGCLSVAITSLVLVALSFITAAWQLYVLIAIAGVVVVAGTRLLISLVSANWFTAKRGLAISIALSGSGFGGAVLSPIVSSIIMSYGWRPASLRSRSSALWRASPSPPSPSTPVPRTSGLSPTAPRRLPRRRPRTLPLPRSSPPRAMVPAGTSSSVIRLSGCSWAPSCSWAS